MYSLKQPMSQSGYRRLVKAAMQQSNDFNLYITCHCFLLCYCNLIAQTVSVGNILFDSISWEEDAMTMHNGNIKDDQKGDNCFARNDYANPKILLFVQCWQCQS